MISTDGCYAAQTPGKLQLFFIFQEQMVAARGWKRMQGMKDQDQCRLPQDIEILCWCPAGPVLPHREKVPL